MMALHVERSALYSSVHGSLGAHGTVAAAALDIEHLVFAWLRLRRTAAALLRRLPAERAASAGASQNKMHHLHVCLRLPASTAGGTLKYQLMCQVR